MKLMSGSKFPKHIGVDFAGIIEDAGHSNFKKGDEVFGVVKNAMKDGALAQFVAVPATHLWKKPSNISFAQAAYLPIAGIAAVTAFEKMGNINPQTEILVNGATGGFGMILLQFLKQKGANVTAVTSPRGIEFAKKWGATISVDYTKENVLTQSKTYDVIIDLSGKMGYANAQQLMKSKALFLNPTLQPIEILTSLFKNLFTGQKLIVILAKPDAKNMTILLNAVNNG